MVAAAKGSVLVTGATGFVGGAVADALLAAGYHVIALVRSERRARALADAGAEPVTGDMLAPEGYRPLVRRADAVVHAAQLRLPGRVTRAGLDRMFAANDLMTDALAEECAAAGRRLVYTSGCFNYGDHGAEWITEETPLDPSPLGVGHARAVLRLREMARRGLDVVVLSLGFVYGPGGNFRTVFYDPARRGLLRCIGPGGNYWSCVHVDDVAAAYVAAIERAAAGAEYNIVDDRPLTLRDLTDQVADAMGLRRRPGTLPVWLAGLVAGRPAVASLTTSYRVANARARAELGWRPRHPDVAAGLPATLAALAGRPRTPAAV